MHVQEGSSLFSKHEKIYRLRQIKIKSNNTIQKATIHHYCQVDVHIKDKTDTIYNVRLLLIKFHKHSKIRVYYFQNIQKYGVHIAQVYYMLTIRFWALNLRHSNCVTPVTVYLIGTTLKTILTSLFMMALWLMLSGIYKPLLVTFGILSVILVMIIVRRMDQIDGDHVRIYLRPIKFFQYVIWLLWEIAKSNWQVTKVILARTMPIQQNLFEVPYTQKSDLGQVIFANSITLTPGTLTIETESKDFLVHSLSYQPEDVAALQDMDRRVSEVESRADK